MSTTVFITRYWKNVAFEGKPGALGRLLLSVWTALLLTSAWAPAAAGADISQLRVERGEDGVYLSAAIAFDLPAPIEDALLKGIPMFFVAEADIYRDRWYWTDARVASAARTVRLAYQPLTRRWRVNVASGLITSSSGLRATLNQNYETLPEALSAVRRIARWRIADPQEVSPDASHKIEFSFRLDLSQLPRPFQIGIAGQRDWDVSGQVRERLRLEPAAAPAPAAEASK